MYRMRQNSSQEIVRLDFYTLILIPYLNASFAKLINAIKSKVEKGNKIVYLHFLYRVLSGLVERETGFHMYLIFIALLKNIFDKFLLRFSLRYVFA